MPARTLEQRPRGRRRAARPLRRRGTVRVASMASTFLASLSSAPAERVEPVDLVQRQLGEQPQEAPDIGVLGVAPELPVLERRAACWRPARPRPAAVLPIFWPAAVVISGVVRPNSWLPSIRRPSSTPLTMLPHWSEPPICSRQP